MIELLQFIYIAYRAYRGAKRNGCYFTVRTQSGVPDICCFVGLGRDAWRISQRAIEEYKLK